MTEQKEMLESVLKKLEISYKVIEHPEVFTVEAMMPYLKDTDGLVCKNLFLKDKKKKKLWLVTALHDQKVNLSSLSKHLKLSGMRLADEEVLLEKLKVPQGSVTPLSLFFDDTLDVNFILDKDLSLSEDAIIYSHPMVNTASVGISYADFKRFVEYTKHETIIVDFKNL